MINENTLARKALLVEVNMSHWTSRKLDRKITTETNVRNNAAQDAGRYNKLLLSKEYMKGIETLVGEIRKFVHNNTSPWTDNGSRILPVANFTDFHAGILRFNEAWDAAVDALVEIYPTAVEASRERLGDMFNREDFPEDIRSRFSLTMKTYPVPSAEDFRVSLSEQDKEMIRESLKKTIGDVHHGVTKDLFNRLKTQYERIADRLGSDREEGKAQVFRNTIVENMKELIELLPKMNVLDDPRIDDLIEASKKLVIHSPEELRDDSFKRKDVATEAADLLARVESYGF
tara:strand:+ start:323 stop:1186 length:864 start_codon:yes stop_codon:yes gene_type:complete